MAFYSEVPVPQERSKLRLAFGMNYFMCKRFVQWHWTSKRYAFKTKDGTISSIPFTVFKHQTPLVRPLKDVDLWLQENKIHNLKLAIEKLNGLVIHPGETLSLWRNIGKPSKRKGYKPGMVLINGTIGVGYGGGLCQLSNLIYWMTLHTPLVVTERYRHQYDVFPDAGRILPFGSGATIAYNYIDLQVYNPLSVPYYLELVVTDNDLCGAWKTDQSPVYQYKVYERIHKFTQHFSGRYIRHNEIWRKVYTTDGEEIGDELVAENHALMMYSPLLQEHH